MQRRKKKKIGEDDFVDENSITEAPTQVASAGKIPSTQSKEESNPFLAMTADLDKLFGDKLGFNSKDLAAALFEAQNAFAFCVLPLP